jgi:hypothetical protein
VVVDTLSPHLDVATLKVGAVSHPYRLEVSGEGRPVLTFAFTNINLPDSNRNEPASHGYLKFSIAPLATVPEQTVIENYADIFFDYNPAVRTNVVMNTVYDLVAGPLDGAGGRVVLCGTNPTATAGENQVICEKDTVRLRAQAPRYGSGNWKRISGGGTIAAPHKAATFATGLAYGDNVFEWSVPVNLCATTPDSLRARVNITLNPKPGKPSVTLSEEGALRCDAAGDRYLWYFNDGPLPDTTRTLPAGEAGNYSVAVVRNGCQSDQSEAFGLKVTGLEPLARSGMSIYPNPGTGRFYLVVPAGAGPVGVTICDALGKTMMHHTVVNYASDAAPHELDLSRCPAGVYLVRLRWAKAGMVVRLVKK